MILDDSAILSAFLKVPQAETIQKPAGVWDSKPRLEINGRTGRADVLIIRTGVREKLHICGFL